MIARSKEEAVEFEDLNDAVAFMKWLQKQNGCTLKNTFVPIRDEYLFWHAGGDIHPVKVTRYVVWFTYPAHIDIFSKYELWIKEQYGVS